MLDRLFERGVLLLESGHGLLELAFSWLLSKDPVASVIAGATKPEQIQANVQAGGWKLSQDELD